MITHESTSAYISAGEGYYSKSGLRFLGQDGGAGVYQYRNDNQLILSTDAPYELATAEYNLDVKPLMESKRGLPPPYQSNGNELREPMYTLAYDEQQNIMRISPYYKHCIVCTSTQRLR